MKARPTQASKAQKEGDRGGTTQEDNNRKKTTQEDNIVSQV
jgi:hypothetical protein